VNTVARFAAALLAMASCALPVACAAQQEAPASTLTLLGTRGGPGAMPERAGIASLVTVGDRHYLIDAGTGVTEQLAKAGVPVTGIDTVFLTHLHDDHTAGLPALMTTSLMAPGTAGITVLGPPQTGRLVSAANAFLDVNADIRIAESGGRIKPPASLFRASEIGTGVVFDDGTVKVTAVENTHYQLTGDERVSRTKSYAFRFDTPDRSIVFTGDTGVSEAVEVLAEGADVLVSEMVSAKDIASVPEFVRAHMADEHLTAEEVGRLAAGSGVGMVVLSHVREPGPEDAKEIARHFRGRIVIGEDLQRF
jgi:ribonuclease BN (tRNA processing enzyme)